MTTATLVLPISDSAVLLAMKKRGFGAGRWNGLGGKVQAGESPERAAIRELREEIGVAAEPTSLEPAGVLEFSFEEKEDVWRIHIFRLRQWQGTPCESEEMRPEWHPLGALPFAAMWPADHLWMPAVLSGIAVEGSVHYDSAGNEIRSHSIRRR